MGLEPEYRPGQNAVTLQGQLLLGSLQLPVDIDFGVISITHRRSFSVFGLIEKSVYLVSEIDVRGYDIIFDWLYLWLVG